MWWRRKNKVLEEVKQRQRQHSKMLEKIWGFEQNLKYWISEAHELERTNGKNRMPSIFCFFLWLVCTPPKGDSPDSSCHFKCCFLFAAFTVFPQFQTKETLVLSRRDLKKVKERDRAGKRQNTLTNQVIHQQWLWERESVCITFRIFLSGFVSSFKTLTFVIIQLRAADDSFARHFSLAA